MIGFYFLLMMYDHDDNQGLLPLQKRFKNSIFICDSDDYLPVYFTPSRNGDRHCQTEEHFIGRRVSRC